MITRFRQSAAVVFCAIALLAFTPEAHAYFVLGDWDEGGTLYYIKWPFGAMDANHDLDISGPDDGILFTLEGGTYGWLDTEV
ncbi:MAG TPA: hypothetical protein HPP77_00995, partial [Candidatus Hydrogenedentes bacterium]|nr:hypothetical protein [Candidatus Hydrogenedentota bacterium]